MKRILEYFVHKKTREHFFKFAVVGALAFLTDFLLLLSLVEFFSVETFIAVSIAYVAGVLVHFNLNKFWNFKNHEEQYHKQVVTYIIGIIIYYFLSVGIIQAFVWLGGHYALGKIFATGALAVLNFFYQRHVTFGRGFYGFINRIVKK